MTASLWVSQFAVFGCTWLTAPSSPYVNYLNCASPLPKSECKAKTERNIIYSSWHCDSLLSKAPLSSWTKACWSVLRSLHGPINKLYMKFLDTVCHIFQDFQHSLEQWIDPQFLRILPSFPMILQVFRIRPLCPRPDCRSKAATSDAANSTAKSRPSTNESQASVGLCTIGFSPPHPVPQMSINFLHLKVSSNQTIRWPIALC